MDLVVLVKMLFIIDGFIKIGVMGRMGRGSCYRWDRKFGIVVLYKERRFVLFMVRNVEGRDFSICDEYVIYDRWYYNGSVYMGRSYYIVR